MSGKFVKAFGDDYVTGSGSLKDSDGVWLQGAPITRICLQVHMNTHQPANILITKAGKHSHGYTLKEIHNDFTTASKDGLTNHIKVTNTGSETRPFGIEL